MLIDVCVLFRPGSGSITTTAIFVLKEEEEENRAGILCLQAGRIKKKEEMQYGPDDRLLVSAVNGFFFFPLLSTHGQLSD